MTRTSVPLLVAIYALATFFAFAILRYLVIFVWTQNPSGEDILVTTRVFFSAPVLILIGVLLLRKFKNLIHRLFGTLFLIVGTIWAVEILKTFFEEAA